MNEATPSVICAGVVLAAMLTSGCASNVKVDLVSVRARTNQLIISFTSNPDLRGHAQNHEFNVGNEVSFCSADQIETPRLLQSDPYVFDQMGVVDPSRQETKSTLYEVRIWIQSVSLNGHHAFAYDLRRNVSDDVCVLLRGGNMIGETTRSNVLKIQAAEISVALAKSH
jgi:hypothetical protein